MLDLLSSRPKLKPNLRYVVQTFGDEGCCIIEDPGTENFWRVGLPEWRLLKGFDGRATVTEALARSDRKGDEELGTVGARSVITWAVQEGLVENLRANQKTPGAARWMQAINASVFYRLRLCNPQPFLEKLYPVLGFLTNPLLIFAWAIVLAAAGLLLVGRWDEFADATFSVVTPDLWLYYILIWWGLKLVHEVFHGLTCLRYGGNVREAGILFLLFAPLGAYVDVTSSWRFWSKWHRMHVTFAGIYIELLIAAIATIIWCFTDDPIVKQICLQTAVLASVATILFNANPLIRFDGYYLLSDYLEVPNLYAQGQIAVRQLFSRAILGLDSRLKAASAGGSWVVLAFGFASFFWRIFLSVGIALAAATLLDGAGLFLALALVISWWVVPLIRNVVAISKLPFSHPGAAARGLFVTAVFVAFGYGVVTRVKLPRYVAAPGIVRPVQSTIVRTEAKGRLVELFVMPGQNVKQGQVLAKLVNPDLDLTVLELKKDIRRGEMRMQHLVAEGLVAEGQAEQQVLLELDQQLAHRLDQQRQLTVIAPHTGIVMDFVLDDLWGKYLRRGDRVVEIADPRTLEFAFSMEQSQMQPFQEKTTEGIAAALLLPELPRIDCQVDAISIDPQARFDLENMGLAATKGGPIPVGERVTQSNVVQTRTLTPRVHGTVPIPSSASITSGVIGTVRVSLPSETVGTLIGPWWDRSWSRLMKQLFS